MDPDAQGDETDTTMKAYPNLPEKDLSDLTAFLLTLK
jgi:hypothetical protein